MLCEIAALGWAPEGAVQDRIDSTVSDALERVRSRLPQGESRIHCEECETLIPEERRRALPGVRLCVACQSQRDAGGDGDFNPYNRRGSKDSQLR